MDASNQADAPAEIPDPKEIPAQLGPLGQSNPDWPKLCQQSWLESFTKWAEEGEHKYLSPETLEAVRHTLDMNLKYIEELENARTEDD